MNLKGKTAVWGKLHLATSLRKANKFDKELRREELDFK